MRSLWLKVRSAVLWAMTGTYFFVVGAILVFFGLVIDPRKNDWPQRLFFRNILRLAGVGLEVRRSPAFDRNRTSIFICNHVNIFDPFVIYSAIPQFVRGFELQSHFRIPVYGWMMGWFGNIPVPEVPTREGLETMIRRARASLDAGISLIGFAEGSRTRDGHVKEFKRGIFSIAQKLGVPIVPVSIVGSYRFFQTGNWILYPGKITVYLHDTIDTSTVQRSSLDDLRRRVQEIVAAPVEESMKETEECGSGALVQ
jgi:1-acyl-sn-glycerol-3-phosphate acyltransferase